MIYSWGPNNFSQQFSLKPFSIPDLANSDQEEEQEKEMKKKVLQP